MANTGACKCSKHHSAEATFAGIVSGCMERKHGADASRHHRINVHQPEDASTDRPGMWGRSGRAAFDLNSLESSRSAVGHNAVTLTKVGWAAAESADKGR
jgi:hypothetical protein